MRLVELSNRHHLTGLASRADGFKLPPGNHQMPNSVTPCQFYWLIQGNVSHLHCKK